MSILPNLSTMTGREFTNQYRTPHKADRERFYRVNIFSKDAVSGNWADGVYQINLDTIEVPNEYHIAVESWIMSSQNTPTKPIPFIVELQDVSQSDTYTTSTKTNTKVILVGQTSSSFGGIQNSIVSSSIGIPLNDTSILKNKQVRITLKGIDDTIATLQTALGNNSSWFLTLLLYPFHSG